MELDNVCTFTVILATSLLRIRSDHVLSDSRCVSHLLDTCLSITTAISQCNHLQHSVPFQDFAFKTSPFFCYLELECTLPGVTTTNWIWLPKEIVDSSHAAYRYFSDYFCRALFFLDAVSWFKQVKTVHCHSEFLTSIRSFSINNTSLLLVLYLLF